MPGLKENFCFITQQRLLCCVILCCEGCVLLCYAVVCWVSEGCALLLSRDCIVVICALSFSEGCVVLYCFKLCFFIQIDVSTRLSRAELCFILLCCRLCCVSCSVIIQIAVLLYLTPVSCEVLYCVMYCCVVSLPDSELLCSVISCSIVLCLCYVVLCCFFT